MRPAAQLDQARLKGCRDRSFLPTARFGAPGRSLSRNCSAPSPPAAVEKVSGAASTVWRKPSERVRDASQWSSRQLLAASSACCLRCALHGIGTQAPREVWLALDRKARKPARLAGARAHRPLLGRDAHLRHRRASILGVPVRMTSPARTVVDCFRYRNKIGLDVALEALRDAVRMRTCDGGRDRARGRGVPRPHGYASPTWRRWRYDHPAAQERRGIGARHGSSTAAVKAGEDFQFLLHRYAAERFLYRLGRVHPPRPLCPQRRYAVRPLGRFDLPAHARPRLYRLR